MADINDTIITLADQDELLENACILIDAYINLNAILYIQPSFHEKVVKDVIHLLKKTVIEPIGGLDDQDTTSDINSSDHINSINELLQAIVEKGMLLFYKHISPPRSNGDSFIRKKPNREKMIHKIKYLQQVLQPEQRTPNWYEFRYKHLTASNIWKTFISDSTRNQLIFEKCQPIANNETKITCAVNIASPMHWGQKYEPLSLRLYEEMYNTEISDFGCIPHQTQTFLAASPDGINTKPEAERYGRMVEVKNIVNREITGVPKMEYWVQMQLQMEVCDLNECDFLETRFIEYPDEEAFLKDQPEIKKGMLMLFMTERGQPIYAYAPLTLAVEDYPAWQEDMMEKNKELNWLKNIYWKLDKFSCVLVLRNKLWFAAALPALQALWQTIETEKQTGYAHRAPKKNASRNKKYAGDENDIALSSKCFIAIDA